MILACALQERDKLLQQAYDDELVAVPKVAQEKLGSCTKEILFANLSKKDA